MAKKEIARFCAEYLSGHPEVRAQINASADQDQFAKAMADAAVKAGFDFTEGDIREVMGPSGGSPDELSDAQLEPVAGGRAGGDRVKYMEFKLKEVLITGV